MPFLRKSILRKNIFSKFWCFFVEFFEFFEISREKNQNTFFSTEKFTWNFPNTSGSYFAHTLYYRRRSFSAKINIFHCAIFEKIDIEKKYFFKVLMFFRWIFRNFRNFERKNQNTFCSTEKFTWNFPNTSGSYFAHTLYYRRRSFSAKINIFHCEISKNSKNSTKKHQNFEKIFFLNIDFLKNGTVKNINFCRELSSTIVERVCKIRTRCIRKIPSELFSWTKCVLIFSLEISKISKNSTKKHQNFEKIFFLNIDFLKNGTVKNINFCREWSSTIVERVCKIWSRCIRKIPSELFSWKKCVLIFSLEISKISKNSTKKHQNFEKLFFLNIDFLKNGTVKNINFCREWSSTIVERVCKIWTRCIRKIPSELFSWKKCVLIFFSRNFENFEKFNEKASKLWKNIFSQYRFSQNQRSRRATRAARGLDWITKTAIGTCGPDCCLCDPIQSLFSFFSMIFVQVPFSTVMFRSLVSACLQPLDQKCTCWSNSTSSTPSLTSQYPSVKFSGQNW